MSFEVDVAGSVSPLKFWGSVITLVLTLTLGSGGVSYALAQQATQDTAKATAAATAREVLAAHEREAERRLDELERSQRSQASSFAGIARDVEWIRNTLERIEARQYQRNGASGR